jgi:ketosteroid isomerase-like protein
MRKLVLVSIAAAFVSVALPAFAANPAAEKAVLGALDAWKDAMLKKDRAGLDKIFHPDLSYGHSGAMVQTKAQAIAGVVDGSGWEKIELTDTTVRLQGNVAIVNGKTDMHEIHKGKPNSISKLVVLTVWVKGPHGWQMIARQAVRRADDDQVIAAHAALAAGSPAKPAAPAPVAPPK